MSDNSPLAENLRNLRAHFGYTLEQTAEGAGVTRQAIAKWESGQGRCSTRKSALHLHFSNSHAAAHDPLGVVANALYPNQSRGH